jgi:protein gp37
VNTTRIEWAEKSWNPIRGCSHMSIGCDNCYAERIAARFSGPGQPFEGAVKMLGETPRFPRWTGELQFLEEKLWEPFSGKGKRIFVCSMSDLFHRKVPFAFIEKVWAVMLLNPQHTFLVLTKRPDRMCQFLNEPEQNILDRIHEMTRRRRIASNHYPPAKFQPPHIWLGTSVENQNRANFRVPWLLQCPAATRWLSCEPLLGPIDLNQAIPTGTCPEGPSLSQIHWIVCGGEFGPGARPMYSKWATGLRDQCVEAGIKFFFKQWGAWMSVEKTPLIPDASPKYWHWPNGQTVSARVTKKQAGRLLDGREWNEYPETVR